MNEEDVKRITLETIKTYNKSQGFFERRITDTPTDAFAVVNRKFVTLNGAIASRPKSSVAVIGQHYFATDTSILTIYGGTGWVNSVGSIVAQNN